MTKISAEKWAKIRKDYEDGLYNLAELAEANGTDLETVKKTADRQGWKRPETDRTLRKLKSHRMQMLEAICSSTMEGLKKADDLLAGCDSLRDVELHSKTVKNYRDICIGKAPDEIFAGKESSLMDELMALSQEDINAVLNES